ncbi:TPA: DUF262 domain-containing protein [Burkholderia aenigmatica]|uniref:DUF262 domain-containing protein n=1 Tax=Burkholderia sp. AU45251 TaxID=3059204 RepID=UPI0026552502|nr:DUF262 domain-containing protein [Burkholderia sp. AU45251]HDR9486723.1 DUF262 domain-containing protein [Burkholderia aenigmatica]MDN7518486.1 DUF262 domain-containing protein [Burkholderia sp. AU45251]HDR9518276.1 DUF262 domain-containing protein [Burkholderia aenigmatica]HDR9595143.1 DUF262 domain-containing protein [Burkholderia aenigmatica]HDR9604399.1 DUF262 domain-containing protein [Burkholderia aenigmatica]
MDITFDRRTVAQCLQQRFALPTYQRDYKWEVKHLQELLTDVQESFLANYDPTHGRIEVAKYSPYFLGTIITTPAESGQRAIVDGQQRITTLALIIAYYCQLALKKPELNISDISALLRQKIFGQHEFNIAFDGPRKELFNLIIDGIDPTDENQELDQRIDSIPGLDHSSRQLYKLYTNIENFIGKRIQDELTPHFVDYLTQCVYLFEIGVPREQDGHKVFVTMNDRGLKLSPIDLLKGYFLSNIRDDAANQTAHQKWNECLAKLKDLGSDEDSAFFKTWLRAQYADSTRGKNRGDAPGEFEIIGDSYHRWVTDNKTKLGLNTADDFYDLLTVTIPTYVDHYLKIKKAEEQFRTTFPHVYFNGARDLTLQAMAILSTITPNDTGSDVNRKIQMVSYYLDFLAVSRIVSNQDNTYDNVRDPIFGLVKSIRRKSVVDLRSILTNLIDTQESTLDQLKNLSYWDAKKQNILHLLARIATYLEDSIEQTNRVGFPTYADRSRGNRNFDIEHILAGSHDSVKAALGADYDFSSTTDFASERNKIGGLILLPRGRNRSLQDKQYSDKVTVYATENALAQTLAAGFYANNPLLQRFMEMNSIMMNPISVFNRAAITERGELYALLARRIWGKAAFEAIAPTPAPDAIASSAGPTS